MTWAWGSGLWASAGGRAGRSLRPKVVGKARLTVLVHHQEEMDHGRPHADESAPASRGSRDFLLRGSARVAGGGARGAGLAVWPGAVRTEGRDGRGEGHKRSPLARRCKRRQDAGELSRISWRQERIPHGIQPEIQPRTKSWAVRPRPPGRSTERQTGRRIRSGVGRARCTQEQPRPIRPQTGAPAPHHRAGSADGGGLPRGRARCYAQG